MFINILILRNNRNVYKSEEKIERNDFPKALFNMALLII